MACSVLAPELASLTQEALYNSVTTVDKNGLEDDQKIPRGW